MTFRRLEEAQGYCIYHYQRASQQYVDGLSVAQTEYDKELKARRDAEAEVTRLRVLLSGQQVRLQAVLGEAKRLEAQKQLSKDLSDSLTSMEQDLAKLQVERDMAMAEVEELGEHMTDCHCSAEQGTAVELQRDTPVAGAV